MNFFSSNTEAAQGFCDEVDIRIVIECFHSRGQHLCKFIGTEESVSIRKEFNSHRIGLGHQHGGRFIVLGHQYGRRDLMWKHSNRPIKEAKSFGWIKEHALWGPNSQILATVSGAKFPRAYTRIPKLASTGFENEFSWRGDQLRVTTIHRKKN